MRGHLATHGDGPVVAGVLEAIVDAIAGGAADESPRVAPRVLVRLTAGLIGIGLAELAWVMRRAGATGAATAPSRHAWVAILRSLPARIAT